MRLSVCDRPIPPFTNSTIRTSRAHALLISALQTKLRYFALFVIAIATSLPSGLPIFHPRDCNACRSPARIVETAESLREDRLAKEKEAEVGGTAWLISAESWFAPKTKS